MDEKDVKKLITDILIERSKDIYEDGLKPSTKEAGEALGSILGLFNHVVLYPVKKANITFQYKLQEFKREMESRVKEIPHEKLISVPLQLAGPTLEALKYTYDVYELREMYLNLLASGMHIDTSEKIHPSFVEIIKSMSPIDAKVLKCFQHKSHYTIARIECRNKGLVYSGKLPSLFSPELLVIEDEFLVSAGIENLIRLGLLVLPTGSSVNEDEMDNISNHPFVRGKYQEWQSLHPSSNISFNMRVSTLILTDLGKCFIDTCIS